MSAYKQVKILAGAELRRGVSADGDPAVSNLITTLGAGTHTALVQCRGARYQDEHQNYNHWWVLLDTAPEMGWVSAVWIDEGDDDEQIIGVRSTPTVFELPGVFGATPVHVVKAGAPLRRGGSWHSIPDNLIGNIPGGDVLYRAYAQCAGEYFEEGGQHNVRWVLLDTPRGIGWVHAVKIVEGGNDAAIPGVPEVPTRNVFPPELLV
jgi:hypothetical protein